jgi:phospholipid/cholesterol/gamma-HCH transport system permease protein
MNHPVQRLGAAVLGRARAAGLFLIASTAAAGLALVPRTWIPLVRRTLSRQIVAIGVGGVGLTAAAGVLAGISVVVQSQLWLGRLAGSGWLGALLVVVIVRELGPLLANLIAIARSGAPMVVELATMKRDGEVRVLDGLGIDRFRFLVVPRAVAMALSVFCLAIVFIVLSLVSGYAVAAWNGIYTRRPAEFFAAVTGAAGWVDLVNVLVKTLLPGLASGLICCMHGLAAPAGPGSMLEASARAVQRAVFALFVVSAAVSLITYW